MSNGATVNVMNQHKESTINKPKINKTRIELGLGLDGYMCGARLRDNRSGGRPGRRAACAGGGSVINIDHCFIWATLELSAGVRNITPST